MWRKKHERINDGRNNIFMKNEKKKDTKVLLNIVSKIFNVLFYVAITIVMLSIMISLIVLIVNVPTEEMLLPPYMKKIYDDNGVIVEYSINLGNGASIVKPASEVTLGNIESVISCFLFIMSATIAAFTPIFRFLSIILKSFFKNNVFDRSNYRLINYIGVTTIISGFFLGLVERFVNYTLFKTFVTNVDNVSLKFGVNFQLVLIGAVIMILSAIIRIMIDEHEKCNFSETSMIEYDQ